MLYTFKTIKYNSIRTGNKLVDEVVDIEKYAADTNQSGELENEKLWNDKFIYRRNINGILYPAYNISITDFMKTIDNINVDKAKSIIDIYNIVEKLAKEYAKWCNAIDTCYDIIQTENFCKGMLGEYVWHWYLVYNKKLRLSFNGQQTEYLFDNICLRDLNDIDFGVDNIGEVEINGKDKHNCIFQFKFYSPDSNEEITLKYIQGIHDDGCNNGFISRRPDEVNTFICWLGTDKKVSKWLQKEKTLNACVKFIDIDAIKINRSDDILHKIVNKINNIKNLG